MGNECEMTAGTRGIKADCAWKTIVLFSKKNGRTVNARRQSERYLRGWHSFNFRNLLLILSAAQSARSLVDWKNWRGKKNHPVRVRWLLIHLGSPDFRKLYVIYYLFFGVYYDGGPRRKSRKLFDYPVRTDNAMVVIRVGESPEYS